MIFGTCDMHIHSLNKDTGVENWNHLLGTAHIHSGFILGQNGTIYGVDSNGTFDALNPADGTELWSATLDMMNYNAPCIDANGVMYVGGTDLTAVGPRFYKTDALIKRSTDTTFVGGGVYNTTGVNQSVAQTISGTMTGVYNIKLQNEGNAPDTFTVTEPAGNANWTIAYLDATSQDITAQVTGGGWTSPQVADGAAYDLQLQVSDNAAADGSSTDVLTLVTSGNDTTSQDAVLAHTKLQMVPVAAPVFAPVPGVYTGGVTVTITCATPGAIMRYTTDGTTPTAASSLYAASIPLAATTTLEAAAYASKMADSPVTVGVYTVGVSTPILTRRPAHIRTRSA